MSTTLKSNDREVLFTNAVTEEEQRARFACACLLVEAEKSPASLAAVDKFLAEVTVLVDAL